MADDEAPEPVDTQHVALQRAKDLLADLDKPPPEVNAARGAETRLRTYVPTPGPDGTTLVLGEAFPGASYRGLGVVTSGNMVMTATSAASTLTLSAPSQVLIQSAEANLYAVARKSIVVAGAGDASLLSTKGITIAAGWEKDTWYSGVASKDPILESPDSYRKTMADITAKWGDRDGLVALANIGKTVATDACGTKLWEKIYSGMLGVGPAIVDYLAGPQVTIHAPAGYLLGTDQFGAIYAGAGIDMVAAQTSVVGILDAELFAGNNAALTGGRDVSVSALWSAGVISYYKSTEIACRKGDVEIYGKGIRIGTVTAAPVGTAKFTRANQQPTRAIYVAAVENIVLTTGADQRPPPDGIHLASHQDIEQRAKQAVTVEAGERVEIGLKDQAVSVKLQKGKPQVVLQAGESGISVDEGSVALVGPQPGGLRVRGRGAAEVEVSKSQVTIGFGSNSKKLVITPNGLTYANRTIVVKP